MQNRVMRILLFVCLLTSVLGINESKATHAMGADITFECLGGDEYLIRLKLYRDCEGINVGNDQTIEIEGCGESIEIDLDLVTGPTEVSPLCPSQLQNSSCNSGWLPGVQEVIYELVVTLDDPCPDYEISWELCCRNNAITTLDDPEDQEMYIEAILDNTLLPCNNSPVFNNIPTPYVCVGQPVAYNHGVTDSDGDQLIFSLVDCYEGNNNTVDYENGYSNTVPLTTINGVTIDTLTGAIAFTPSITQIGVLCVLVEEYRNGVKISETVRDMQFVVMNCNNTPPVATEFIENGTSTGSYTYFVCSGGSFCLSIDGYDDDGNNVSMNWNNGIPDGTFTITNNNSLSPSATFCWNPQPSDVGVHFFTVTEQDDACPLIGITTETYTVIVSAFADPIFASINPNPVTICPGGSETLVSTISPIVGSYGYTWFDGPNGTGNVVSNFPNYDPLAGGNYSLIVEDLNSGGCALDTVNVLVAENPEPQVNPLITGVCQGQQTVVELSDTLTYIWSPATGLSCTNCHNPIVTINQTTTYSVTATNNFGCETIQSITIPVYSVNATISPDLSDPCIVGDDGILTATGNGGFPPYTYNWSNNGNTATVSNLPAGTYIVSVEDSNGCLATASTIVNPPSDLTIIPEIQLISCSGESDGSISVIPSGGSSPYQYNWNVIATGNSIMNLGPGNYSVTIIDANNCQETQMFSFVDPLVLTTDVVLDQEIQCFGGNDGIATISVTGGTDPYSYLWDSGETSSTVSTLSAGLHLVTVTDLSGCVATDLFVIIEPPNLTPLSNSIAVTCNGENDGSIISNVQGGTQPYQFQWSNGSTEALATGLSAGSYQLTVTDGNGCIRTISDIVTEPPKLVITPILNQGVSCVNGSDGSATVNTSGGTLSYTYIWDNGETTSTAVGLNSGIHHVTITDANNCEEVNTFFISQASPLFTSASVLQNVSCNTGSDGSAIANAVGGTTPYSYEWDNGEMTATANSLPFGFHVVTITDVNGCTETNGVNLTQPSVLNIFALHASNPTCFSEMDGSANTFAFGGVPPYQYEWDNGETTSSAVSLSTGVYTVTVTDANGCQQTDDVVITTTPALVSGATTTQDITCFGENDGSANGFATGGTSPYTYLWDSGDFTSTANFLTPGTHFLTVTDNNGCESTTSVVILEPPLMILNTSAVQNVNCYGETNGSFDLDVAGGTPGYTVDWNGPVSGSSSLATVGTINVTGLIQGTYSIVVTDANLCVSTDQVVITQPLEIITAETANTNAVCGACDGTSAISVSGGTPPYNFVWTNGSTNSNPTNLCQGAHLVTITDLQGCTEIVSVAIGAVTPISITNVDITDPLCSGSLDGSVEITASGGIPPYTFNWSNGIPDTDGSVTGLAAGSYFVSISSTAGGVCLQTALVTLTEPNQLIATSNVIQIPSCTGGSDGSVTISVSGGTTPYTYLWENGETSATAIALASGNNVVSITDANNCELISSVAVGTLPQLSILPNNFNDVDCFGNLNGEISIFISGGTAPYSYSWSGPSMGSNTQAIEGTSLISGLGIGTYDFFITDDNGCTNTGSAIINEPAELLVASSVLADIDCNGNSNGSATVLMSGGVIPYEFIWDNGEQTATATALSGGTHSVTITDDNGCSLTSGIFIDEPTNFETTIGSSQNITCFSGNDGSATLSTTGGVPPYTYQWSNGNTTDNVSNVFAGIYNITTTDANGCTNNLLISISEPLPILATAQNSQTVSCTGNSDGTISGTITDGTAPYSYSWSGPSNGAGTLSSAGAYSITNLAAGFYTITVVDGNMCQLILGGDVTEPIPLTSQILSAINVSCPNGSDGSASITPNGGTPPYSYMWSNGATTSTMANVAASNYIITVTDNEGCSVTNMVVITEPTIVLTVSLQSNVSCNGGSDGVAIASVSGGVPPYQYLWSNGETTASAINLSVGTNSVTIFDANTCEESASVLISEPIPLSVVLSVDASVSCNGGNDGEASVAATGGTAPYNYSWNNGSTADVAQLLTAGTITITVTDALNCELILNDVITEPDLLVSNISGSTDVTCFGSSDGTSIVGVSGGTIPYIYAWSNGQTTASASGLAATNYGVTISDVNGCVTISNVVLTQPTQLMLSEVSTNITCFGDDNGSSIISITGGIPPYTYLWPSGNTTDTENNLTPGPHIATVTDANFCTETIEVIILEPPTLSIGAVPVVDASCSGGMDGVASVNVQGGTPNYQFLWSNGNTKQTALALAAGTYIVTVTDENNCTEIESVVVGEPNSLNGIITTSTNVSCFSGSNGSATVSATGGTAPYTYSWDNGETSDTATGLTADTYIVTVGDDNQCISYLPVIITEPLLLTISAANTQLVSCIGGGDGIISGTISDGTGPYVYNWSGPSSGTDNLGGAGGYTITNLSAGTYDLTVTDNLSCTATTSVVVTEVPTLSTQIATSINTTCPGYSDGSATASTTGGTMPYTYVWSNSQTTDIVTNIGAGSYEVTVTDNLGCTATSTVTITEPVLNTSSQLNNNVSCNGGNDGSATATITGGISPYTYSWTSGESTSTATGLVVGTNIYTITDANGCVETGSIQLTEPTQLVGTLTVDVNVSCTGGNDGSASVLASEGTPPYTYVWSNGSTTTVATGLSATGVSVTVTDNLGCTIIENATVTEPLLLTISAANTQLVSCIGGGDGIISGTISDGTGPYVYNWSGPSSGTDNLGGAGGYTITNLSAGTYDLTVTDNLSCTATTSVVVTEVPTLSTQIATSINTTCPGYSDGSATASTTGGTMPYTYVWSNSQTTNIVTNIGAGSYEVTVTDNLGCTATSTVTITEPVLNTSSQLNNNVSCNGGNDGSATATITGGISPYTYSWTSGESTSTATGLVVGTNIYTITDANGCVETGSIQLTEPTQLEGTLTVDVNVSCTGGNDGSASVLASEGTPPYTYVWSNGSTTTVATGLSATGVSVTVTDNLGCTIIENATVTEPLLLTISAANTQLVSCIGGGDGIISGTISDGTGPYVYNWSGPSSGTDNLGGAGGYTITNLSAGTYDLTVTDNLSCTATTSVVVTEVPTLSTQIATSINTTCPGYSDGSAMASTTGGTMPYTYVWSNSQTTDIVTNIGAGSYEVTVTDNLGCTATSTVTITEPVLNTSSQLNNNVSCNGGNDGSATATITGGISPYTYAWTSGESTSTATGLVVGTNIYTITDANGCVETGSIQLTEPTQLEGTLTVDVNVSCTGDNDGSASVLASEGTPPYTYVWSNGLTTATAFGFGAGPVSVTITDNLGCEIVENNLITEPVELTSSTIVASAINCFMGSDGEALVIPVGGTVPYSYLWPNGQTTAQATGLVQGTHLVVVTDANGCVSTNSVSFVHPSEVLLSSTNINDVSCSGFNDGSASVLATGGTPPYIYVWPSGAVGPNDANLSPGTYEVSVTDFNLCESTIQISITEPAPFSVTAAVSGNISCPGGSDGILVATGQGGTLPYTYIWSNGNTTGTATGIQAGLHQVTLTDANSCMTTGFVVLNDPSSIIIDPMILIPVSCSGQSDGSATITVIGGMAPYIYIWENGEVSATATGLNVGTHSVTVLDANGCPGMASISVPANEVLDIQINNDNTIPCFGESSGIATAGVSGGTPPYNFIWQTGATGTTATGLSAGATTLTVTDSRGCSVTGVTNFTTPTQINGVADPVQPICYGDANGSITLTATGGSEPYVYAIGTNSFTTNSTIIGLSSGNYDVTIMDANGCEWTENVSISDPQQFVLEATPDYYEVILGDSNTLNTIVNTNDTVIYQWTPGEYLSCTDCASPISTPLANITYEVVGIDQNGCISSDEIEIIVDVEDNVWVPNGFTPNGDQINDILILFGNQGVEKVKFFRVFDRWGEVVFEAADFQPNDPIFGWDGTFRGRKLNPAVFVYHAVVEFVNGTAIEYKGDVTLLR